MNLSVEYVYGGSDTGGLGSATYLYDAMGECLKYGHRGFPIQPAATH